MSIPVPLTANLRITLDHVNIKCCMTCCSKTVPIECSECESLDYLKSLPQERELVLSRNRSVLTQDGRVKGAIKKKLPGELRGRVVTPMSQKTTATYYERLVQATSRELVALAAALQGIDFEKMYHEGQPLCPKHVVQITEALQEIFPYLNALQQILQQNDEQEKSIEVSEEVDRSSVSSDSFYSIKDGEEEAQTTPSPKMIREKSYQHFTLEEFKKLRNKCQKIPTKLEHVARTAVDPEGGWTISSEEAKKLIELAKMFIPKS